LAESSAGLGVIFLRVRMAAVEMARVMEAVER
jgi:hypothetical protein